MTSFKAKVFFCLASFFYVGANPQDPDVLSGQVSFDGLGTSFLNVHASDQSIINWESFSIEANEVTRFIQSGKDAAVLNRVTGSFSSEILGTLQSNGKVYLVNPNGIVIGKDGVVEVGSFIGSSFNVSDSDFLKETNFLFEGDSLATVENKGKVKACHGDIVLLSHRIENKGSLSAKTGNVLLGAGHRILLGLKDNNFVYISPELPGDGVENEGSIEAINTIIESNSNLFALGIQNKGSIDALEVQEENGTIYLRSENSLLKNVGAICAVKGAVFIEAKNASIENHNLIEGKNICLHTSDDSLALADQSPISNYSSVKAETILINSAKFENCGSLMAEGEISIFAPGAYIETANGTLVAKNGDIKILTGNYFSSGSITAKGRTITVEAETLSSTAARFDVSSSEQGGNIRLVASGPTASLYLNEHVVLDASSLKKGGKIEIVSPLPITSKATLKYDGKEKGTLVVPSTVSDNQATLGMVDPYKNEKSALWTAYAKAKEKPTWQIWDRNTKIKQLSSYELYLAACPPAAQVELEDPNASGTSSSFGDIIQTLSNGNVVVTKPNDNFGAATAGAVYLYNAGTGALLSVLRGSSATDQVGSGGITVLTNGNYVVRSPSWNNGGATDAGAVTFGDGLTGVSGTVSASNSLIGSSTNDNVGFSGVTALTNGNYVVSSSSWDNGAIANAGAVTFCDGTTGLSGAVSTSNSLFGTTANDEVGGIVALTNGNYVVASQNWDNGGTANVGAVTFCDGTSGLVGAVSTSNSLFGSTANDQVGGNGVTALTNGNYVVASRNWDNGGTANVGAVTFCDGTSGLVGAVSTSNSLFGSTAGDLVGVVTALTNGNYVVSSSSWDNGAIANAGAVTFSSGITGITGAVSTSNSLFGTTANDQVGSVSVTALTNGNYVVASPNWDNGAAIDAGAVTFCNGTTGLTGAVSTSNSLVGGTSSDNVGDVGVTALANGNYVVTSSAWEGSSFFGAVTFGSGTTGVVGVVSSANSLVGSTFFDFVGGGGIIALSNGNYVVSSPIWNNGAATTAGALTFGSGVTGVSGVVSAANSIVGSSAGDEVSAGGIVELSNEFAFVSALWDNGGTSDAGAVTLASLTDGTFCDGTLGAVSASNSFVGDSASSGLSNVTTSNVSDNLLLVRFNNYDGQTRIFSIAGTPDPTPTPPTPASSSTSSIVSAEAKGIHEFAVAVTEAFKSWNWLSLKGPLDVASIYPPMAIFKNQVLYLPSLVDTKSNL